MNYSHYILSKKHYVLKGLSCPIGLTTDGLVSLRTDYHLFHTELPNHCAFKAVRIYKLSPGISKAVTIWQYFTKNNWLQCIIQHYTTNAHCRVLLTLNGQALSLLRVVYNDDETILLLLTTFCPFRRRAASATPGLLSCPLPSLVASCKVFPFSLRQLSHMLISFYLWPSSSPRTLNSCFPYLPRVPVALHPNCVLG